MVTDLSRYGALRDGWSSLAGHFPEEVPGSAISADVSSFPGFLQGGGWLQLRLTLPAREVAAIEEQCARRAIGRFEGGGGTSRHRDEPDGLPTTVFRTGPGESGGFPSSFTLYVLEAEDRGSPGHAWNHGSSAGLAISEETDEVVYWAERW
ncbi:hypothetical protein AB1L88_21500 [Tautonia sp. JC769]|uniref:hypothetical protein n=1 Tax=Tautonia sp. JC769 TaxID=3232135 RepID=UPI00345ADBBB